MTNSNHSLWKLTASELSKGIRTKAYSCREVVQSCLDRVEEVNSEFNAVVSLQAADALAAADAADKAVAQGDDLGSLHGIPVTTKVNVDQKGLPTTNGVVAFKDLVAPSDNPVISNLRKAGAIIIGRTNTPAFSMRWFTDNDLHGRTLNP
jgi:amidase